MNMDKRTNREDLPDALKEDMRLKNIDIDLTLKILNDYNAGLYDNVQQVRASGVPAIDSQTVVDVRKRHQKDAVLFWMPEDEARANLAKFGLDLPKETTSFVANHTQVTSSKNPESVQLSATTRTSSTIKTPGRMMEFTAMDLEKIGSALLPITGYGVLNGGSATSYADTKKNLALGEDVFAVLKTKFEKMALACKDQPKGLTPAYINPDGSLGASFLELKMRARLEQFARLKALGQEDPTVEEALRATAEFMPLFQMTSAGNNAQLLEAYKTMAQSQLLKPLSQELGIESALWHTGVQNMIAAYTHSSEGRPKRIFDHAYGKENSSLALPGGHGQCFHVLSDVFKNLYAHGTRFVYLGNVDNIAYTPDPLELALLALSGRPAAFEFSVRTPMDIKGGVLVRTENGGYTIADIGPAISFEEVLRLEKEGNTMLFNCAVGLFDLSYLVENLEELSRKLPVRFTDQDKDAGRYSQAEQVTWEVLGCLPSFLAFAVDKNERFLAAKLLIDTLLTSGVGLDDERLPVTLRNVAQNLHQGLVSLLKKTYGLVLSCGKWVPGESQGHS